MSAPIGEKSFKSKKPSSSGTVSSGYYKVSDRITELAQPKQKTMETELRKHPFAVARSALHANASSRVMELAKPKYDFSSKRNLSKKRAKTSASKTS